MKKAIVVNKTYKTLLIIVCIISLVFGVLSLLFSKDYLSILAILFNSILLVLLFTEHKKLQLAIQITMTLTLLGSGLQFIALFLRLAGGSYKNIDVTSIIANVITLIIAIYFFKGSIKYIEFREN